MTDLWIDREVRRHVNAWFGANVRALTFDVINAEITGDRVTSNTHCTDCKSGPWGYGHMNNGVCPNCTGGW